VRLVTARSTVFDERTLQPGDEPILAHLTAEPSVLDAWMASPDGKTAIDGRRLGAAQDKMSRR
jgi:hypothetical protein